MSVLSLPMSQITAPRTKPLWTQARTELLALARRISRDGLLNPLTVKKSGKSFIVTDGAKRLIAMKFLAKIGRLPRSLSTIPVIIVDTEEAQPAEPVKSRRPALLSDTALTQAIIDCRKSGQSDLEIIERFECSYVTLNMVFSLTRLHPQIREYFNSGHISLEQAAAFATLGNVEAQWRLLQELGPFAHAKDVITAILHGETVIQMPDGDMMIMPSRQPAPATRLKRGTSAEHINDGPEYKIAA